MLALAILAPTLLSPALAGRDKDEEPSTWEQSRREYLDKREAYIEKRQAYFHKYKKRIGNNKYRQKAREFYGRQETIYWDEPPDDEDKDGKHRHRDRDQEKDAEKSK
jgi:hypothetical protein